MEISHLSTEHICINDFNPVSLHQIFPFQITKGFHQLFIVSRLYDLSVKYADTIVDSKYATRCYRIASG